MSKALRDLIHESASEDSLLEELASGSPEGTSAEGKALEPEEREALFSVKDLLYLPLMAHTGPRRWRR